MKINFIDQKKNFNNSFGAIYRTSAIFYIPKNVKTHICISNYWEFKNNVKVGIVITTRLLNGKLFSREEKNFNNSNVLVISNFGVKEGSVEIEAFGNQNLRIPYAAVMGVYESKKSINMVHTYARNHSLIELEENNAITKAKESCWTIKPSFENKAVFHNGHLITNKQIAKIILNNQNGKEISKNFLIPELKPFETFIFDIKKIFPKFRKFLSNKNGFATLHFKNSSSFTRLLLCWSSRNNEEFQTTHSNFDYSNYLTNKVKTKKGGEMTIPKLPNNIQNLELIVYPKFEKGKYFCKFDNGERKNFSKGFIKPLNNNINKVNFFSKKNYIPSRIVTGMSGALLNQKIPFECSMGINHENARKKRFGWALVSGKNINLISINKISIINEDYSKLFTFKLYNCSNKKILTRVKNLNLGNENRTFLDLKKIFPNYKKFLGKNYGYISIFNSCSSIRFYTSIIDNKKGMSLEHAF